MTNKKASIYSALAANLLIAITKFAAGTFSNSASMIAEGIHSLVDTVNQLLLLFGLKRSKKPADALHPFGYGKELYFYSFIVSILIFGLGGGISIYQGVLHIANPEPPGNPAWNYAVLTISIIFECISLIIAAKAFNKLRGQQTWWNAIVKSKDPSNFIVLFEDGAAVLGLLIVMICMFFNHWLKLPQLDGIASLLVGLLLVGVSLILARESRSLLLGEGISPASREKLITITEQVPGVAKVLTVVSTYQSPDEVLLMLIVTFREGLDTHQINKTINNIQTEISKEFKLIRFIIVQPEEYTRQFKF